MTLAPADAAALSRSRGAALLPIQLLTFINSFGTGLVTSGVFFITSNAYHFTALQNFLLGIFVGVTYIAGAMAAKPILHAAARAGLSTRTVLSLVLGAIGALCVIPYASAALAPSGPPLVWPIWCMVLMYSPLTGILWPIVESYISGGRRAAELRSAIGNWNVIWSCAVTLSYFVVSPLTGTYAPVAILALGLLHIGSIACLPWMGREPAEHLHEEHEPHPPVYNKLLVTFRMLLPTAYIVMSALNPYLPEAVKPLGIPENLHMAVAAAWALPRAATFFLFSRWQSWHGRWAPVIVGGAMLMGGFAITVLSPLVADLAGNSVAIALMLAGLAIFGVSLAVIYSGAIYYAMEVGNAEVSAGGMHEALIGVGYTAGPACGLAATLATNNGLIPPRGFHVAVLGTVGLIAAGVAVAVVHRVRKHTSGETILPAKRTV